jgi:hypothetical protein
MKKGIFIFLLIANFPVFSQIRTPQPSPNTTISQEMGLTRITLNYSRPSIKGRVIFGILVPYGKVWRTGANQITSIKFDADVSINGQMVKAGSYGLYTIPGLKTWKIIFNSEDQKWGAYEYDPKKDVMSFEVVPQKLKNKVEHFKIEFAEFTTTSAYISIAWEKTAVRFKVEQNVQDQILSEIIEKTKAANPTESTLMAAADYYYENNINLPQALIWAQQVVEKDKQYWTYQLVARIAAKLGQCDIAVPNAEKSMELAIKGNDDAYILKNKNVLKTCAKSK